MLSTPQLKLIHLARRQTGMEDADYRTGLRSIAGVESSKDLTLTSFEDILAWLESCGFRDTRGERYWRDLVDRRSRAANPRQMHIINALAAQLAAKQVTYPLKFFVLQMSGQRTDKAEHLTPHEAEQVIEALKAISRRPARPEPARPEAAKPAEKKNPVARCVSPVSSSASPASLREPYLSDLDIPF